MSDIGESKILAEMRVMAAQARAGVNEVNAEHSAEIFADTLKDAMSNINQYQKEAKTMKEQFTKGDPNVSLVDTMIASQKAGLAFDAAVSVRNKLVEAYKEIMNMPL